MHSSAPMMVMLSQLFLAVFLAVGGLWLGVWLTRRPGLWWLLSFTFSMTGLGAVILARRVVRLSFIQPLAWINLADVSFAFMSAAIALLFGVLIPRLRLSRQRRVVSLFMVFVLGYYGLLPVLLPCIARFDLLATPTRFDAAGVCRQQHRYSCGAAAAVNALGMLGVHNDNVQEGTIGAAAGTSLIGTDSALLADALNRLFAQQGVHAEYRWIGGLPEL